MGRKQTAAKRLRRSVLDALKSLPESFTKLGKACYMWAYGPRIPSAESPTCRPYLDVPVHLEKTDSSKGQYCGQRSRDCSIFQYILPICVDYKNM